MDDATLMWRDRFIDMVFQYILRCEDRYYDAHALGGRGYFTPYLPPKKILEIPFGGNSGGIQELTCSWRESDYYVSNLMAFIYGCFDLAPSRDFPRLRAHSSFEYIEEGQEGTYPDLAGCMAIHYRNVDEHPSVLNYLIKKPHSDRHSATTYFLESPIQKWVDAHRAIDSGNTTILALLLSVAKEAIAVIEGVGSYDSGESYQYSNREFYPPFEISLFDTHTERPVILNPKGHRLMDAWVEKYMKN